MGSHLPQPPHGRLSSAHSQWSLVERSGGRSSEVAGTLVDSSESDLSLLLGAGPSKANMHSCWPSFLRKCLPSSPTHPAVTSLLLGHEASSVLEICANCIENSFLSINSSCKLHVGAEPGIIHKKSQNSPRHFFFIDEALEQSNSSYQAIFTI